jgi:MarR family transcriptional regulator for hemolysin
LTSKFLSRAFDEALSQSGGSIPIWLILRALRDAEHRAQRELARSVGIEGSTLTTHLDNLEHAGLVRRIRDSSDRRTIHVELTEAGNEKYDELLRAVIAFDRRLRAGFDEQELEILGRALDRLQENVRGREESPGDAGGAAPVTGG